MKKIFLSILLVFSLPLFLTAQNFVKEYDKSTGKPLFRGKIQFNDLLKESTCSWLGESAQSCQPNSMDLQNISDNKENYRFVLFVGTWCGDTKEVLPKFYKTMLESGITQGAIEMYGVNREKHSLKEEDKIYKIERVPTIIVLNQNREVGRIIEMPQTTIEHDIATMIVKDVQDLEEKKIAKEIEFEKNRQDEMNRMKKRERKKYFYTDYYFPNSNQ